MSELELTIDSLHALPEEKAKVNWLHWVHENRLIQKLLERANRPMNAGSPEVLMARAQSMRTVNTLLAQSVKKPIIK